MLIVDKYSDFYDFLHFNVNSHLVLKRDYLSHIAKISKKFNQEINEGFKNSLFDYFKNNEKEMVDYLKQCKNENYNKLLKVFQKKEELNWFSGFKLSKLIGIGGNYYPVFLFDCKKTANGYIHLDGKEVKENEIYLPFPILKSYSKQLEKSINNQKEYKIINDYLGFGNYANFIDKKLGFIEQNQRFPIILLHCNLNIYNLEKPLFDIITQRNENKIFKEDKNYVTLTNFSFTQLEINNKDFINYLKQNAMKIYQDLEFFIGLDYSKEEILEVSNDDKIVKSGFDKKTSFRKNK